MLKVRLNSNVRSKKKIVIISPIFNPNKLRGSERVNYSVAQLLSLNGFEVTILASTLPELRYFNGLFKMYSLPTNESINNIRIIRLQTNKVINVFWYLLNIFSKKIPILKQFPYGVYFNKNELIKSLQCINPDIIYSSILPFHHNKIISDNMGLLNVANFILRTETHPYQRLYTSNKNKEILAMTSVIQTSTYAEKKLLMALFGVIDTKIRVVPPLIEDAPSIKNNVSRKFNFSFRGKKIVLFIGKKNNEKGCINLLKAVRKLWATDNTYLLIVAGETSLEWKINKLIYGGPFLVNLGWVSESIKEELFSICMLFCMPSIVESFGIVYIEAWKRKKPVIAIRSIISEEMIETHKTGLVINNDNIDELILAIKSIMDNKTLAKKLGENGYRLYKRKYFNKKIELQYLELFSYDKKLTNKK